MIDGPQKDDSNRPPEDLIYGYRKERDVIEARIGRGPHQSQVIYNELLKNVVEERNGRRKKSRAEEKWGLIDWKNVWANHQKIKLVRPVVKERAWMIKHDMLPALRARAFRHRIVVGPEDKLCKWAGCREEETLEHFFFLCPGAGDIFQRLKRALSGYMGVGGCGDLQFLLGDVSVPRRKEKTYFWFQYTFLSWMYEARKGGLAAKFMGQDQGGCQGVEDLPWGIQV